MRLIRFENSQESTEQLGLEIKEGVINTAKLAEHLNLDVPQTMEELLLNTPLGLEQLEDVIAEAKRLKVPFNNYLISRSKIETLPLIKKPEKILCVGMNYVDHIKATKAEVPTTPVFFGKFPNALAADKQNIPLPAIANKVDYEAELVIVIGKETKNTCKNKAWDSILGFTIGNDLTERELQYETSQWLTGKNLDYFAPVGPVLVTKEEIDDVQNLKIRTKRNGKIVQNGSTKDMLFSVDQIVSKASQYMTLKPGDLIFTGTPKGVILDQPEENQHWLESNDTIDITIQDIGTLSNTLI